MTRTFEHVGYWLVVAFGARALYQAVKQTRDNLRAPA